MALPRRLRSARGRRCAEELVELGARRRFREGVEATALGNAPSGTHEAGPGRARECAADADSTHTERRQVVDTELARPADEHVHGLRRNGLDNCRDMLA